MYAQITSIQVPLDKMNRMREIVHRAYLPKLRVRPGFITAFFLEQIDDPDRAELVVLWENQASVEQFNSTGVLEASISGLATELPGVYVRRQGYVLTVTTGARAEDINQLAAP